MKNAAACALSTGSDFARMGREAARLTSTLKNAAEDGVTTARRAFRKNWNNAEDFVGEVAVAVKRHPLKSMGITFGVAFGIGALGGWLAKRK